MTEIILPGPSDIVELIDKFPEFDPDFLGQYIYGSLEGFANDLLDLVLKYNNAFQNHKVRE